MSLFSRLFGRLSNIRDPNQPRARRVCSIDLHFERLGKRQRHPANVKLVHAGRYRIDAQPYAAQGYVPGDKNGIKRSSGWHHAVHMLGCMPIYPVTSSDQEPEESLPHYLFRNAAEPGPHASKEAAQAAFRTISAEARSFTLNQDTRLVFWIEGDPEYSNGAMQLILVRLD